MRLLISIVLLVPWLAQAASVAKFPAISLNAKTNVLSDNGASLTYNGAPLIGGASWYPYTATDVEGGTIYGISSTNAAWPRTVSFANNYLTNAFSQAGTILQIGTSYDPTGDPLLLTSEIAKGNTLIFWIGDSVGIANTLTNNIGIYFFGASGGYQSDFVGCSDLYELGDGSYQGSSFNGFRQSYSVGNNFNQGFFTNTGAILAIARYGFVGANITRGGYLATFGGTHDFQNAEMDEVSYTIGVGNENYKNVHWATNNYINAFGYGNFESSTLTNAEHLYAFGQDNGQSITGSYTNIYLYGKGANPTRRVDQQVFGGTEMQNLFPGGVASVSAESPVAITATGWTNSFSKNAIVSALGTNATCVVYNGAGSAVSTNTSVAGQTLTMLIQSGGKFITTVGGTIGSAAPF